MGQFVVVLIGALVVAAIGFGIAALVTTADPGLEPAEPDGASVPLPNGRPLAEADLAAVRFDTALRGYRMAQVDAALRRAAYDLGYKQELIDVLEAEVAALRDGRVDEAEDLRSARESAKATAIAAAAQAPVPQPVPAGAAEPAPAGAAAGAPTAALAAARSTGSSAASPAGPVDLGKAGADPVERAPVAEPEPPR